MLSQSPIERLSRSQACLENEAPPSMLLHNTADSTVGTQALAREVDNNGEAPGVTMRRRIAPGNYPREERPDYGVAFKKPSNYIRPATYDGLGSWLDYKSHFEACAALNGWSNREKGLYLAVSLRGQAQGILGNLSGELGQNYNELIKALEDRFAPANQTELYRVQLRERRQKATETLPELGQSIRRLAHLAYLTAPNDVRETLAMKQFVDALVDADMRLRIKQARPQTLNDAIRLAVELEAFVRSDLKRTDQMSHYEWLQMHQRREMLVMAQHLLNLQKR